MKNTILPLVLIIILGFFVQQFFPWWSITIVTAFIGILLGKNSGHSFLLGFLGVALLWGGYALFLSTGNDNILSEKMGSLFGGIGGVGVLIAGSFIGGLVGGLGAMTGYLGKTFFN